MKRRGFITSCAAALVGVPTMLIRGVPEVAEPKKLKRSKPYIREGSPTIWTDGHITVYAINE